MINVYDGINISRVEFKEVLPTSPFKKFLVYKYIQSGI